MFSPTSKINSLAVNVCVRKYDLILNLNGVFFLSLNSQYVLQALAWRVGDSKRRLRLVMESSPKGKAAWADIAHAKF